MVKAETYFLDLSAVQECFVYLLKIAPKSLLKSNKVQKFSFTHQFDQKQVMMMTYYCFKTMYDNIDGDNVGDCDSDIIYMAPSQKPWVIDISNEGWYSTIIPSAFSSSLQLL